MGDKAKKNMKSILIYTRDCDIIEKIEKTKGEIYEQNCKRHFEDD